MPNQYNIPDDINIRFWSRVAITANPDLCWNWQLSLNQDGYGKFWYQKKENHAHRYAWILTNGDIPTGMEVCHTCDNPACCNPNHLWLGTHSDNMKDMVEKQRHRIPHLKGEQHGESKLTWEQVRSIRQRYAAGGIYQYELATEYGVCKMQISRIINFKEWQED